MYIERKLFTKCSLLKECVLLSICSESDDNRKLREQTWKGLEKLHEDGTISINGGDWKLYIEYNILFYL